MKTAKLINIGITKMIIFTFVMGTINLLLSNPSFASTCDACDNTWSRETRELNQIEGKIIQGLGFDDGMIRNDLCSYDDESVSYDVSILHKENKIVFTFLEAKSKLIFTYGKQAEIFNMDIGFLLPGYENRKTIDVAPLYKEIVLKGELITEDELGKRLGFQKTSAVLVLQGGGNQCAEGTDYKKWLLKFDVENNNKWIRYVGSGEFLYNKDSLGHNLRRVAIDMQQKNVTPKTIEQSIPGTLDKIKQVWKISGKGYEAIINTKIIKSKQTVNNIIFTFDQNYGIKLTHLKTLLNDFELLDKKLSDDYNTYLYLPKMKSDKYLPVKMKLYFKTDNDAQESIIEKIIMEQSAVTKFR